MKKAMKVLGILLCAVLLVVGSVAATLAYITAHSGVVKNTFSVGNVAISLDEVKTNKNGQMLGEGDAVVDNAKDALRTKEGNEYLLIPGTTYAKDPTVTVTVNDNKAYVRMLVKMDGAEWSDIVGFLEGYDASVWSLNNPKAEPVGGVVTYEFRYAAGAVDESGKLEPLFTAINLKKDGLTTESEEYKAIMDLDSIWVEAHAIQVEGFEDNQDQAWVEFGTPEGSLTPTAEPEEQA